MIQWPTMRRLHGIMSVATLSARKLLYCTAVVCMVLAAAASASDVCSLTARALRWVSGFEHGNLCHYCHDLSVMKPLFSVLAFYSRLRMAGLGISLCLVVVSASQTRYFFSGCDASHSGLNELRTYLVRVTIVILKLLRSLASSAFGDPFGSFFAGSRLVPETNVGCRHHNRRPARFLSLLT